MSLFRRGVLHRVSTGGGGTGTGILGEVNAFSDLPVSATTGDRYLVLTYSISTPTKLKGVYRWSGSSWDRQNGARAFDVVYDNSGSTLTSINLEASTNELDTKVNGKEPSFTKNTAFNKNFGTVSGTVVEGNDSRFTNHLNSFTQNSGQHIGASEVKARDANGLKLHDDGGNGLIVKDGGNVGIGDTNPQSRLTIKGLTGDSSAIRFIASHGARFTNRFSMYPDGNSTFVFKTLNLGAAVFRDSSNNNVLVISAWNKRIGINTDSPSQALHVVGNAIVSGSLSKGSGSFDIAHPDPVKKDTHRLRHYFVETPSAGGNIYKYQIECKEGENYIDLPDYFEFLNKDSLVWVDPFKHFGRAWGEVIEGGKRAKIVVEKTGIYNILIFADRKDEIAMKEFNKYGIEYQPNK
jgi:hypothetical protein